MKAVWLAGVFIATIGLAAPGASTFTPTFGEAGALAGAAQFRVFYAGDGLWRDCAASDCHAGNRDWGEDSLDYLTWLRWKTTGDRTLIPVGAALVSSAATYPSPCEHVPCASWSDVPVWDAIADAREYEMTGDARALDKARKAFEFVNGAKVFALGACPDIRYQLPMGGGNHLKTLETDANFVKAALLLYGATHERAYLDTAVRQYAAIRRHFLDPALPLYSVYVFDSGTQCTQVPRRFFASVNGDMMWNGLELARITGNERYRAQALATGRAVNTALSDARGVFADLQAENDIVEPLVEAMWLLAGNEHESFARSWILRNASAALGERTADGAFGRFFDGPVPENLITVWQSNGGLALETAAAAVAPGQRSMAANDWTAAKFVHREITSLPASIPVDGSAVALIGAIGAQCCEAGHARVFVDGKETVDGTGIWQNKSSSGKTLPQSVLFAWQWPAPGHHVIRIEPGVSNMKEGGPFAALSGYWER